MFISQTVSVQGSPHSVDSHVSVDANHEHFPHTSKDVIDLGWEIAYLCGQSAIRPRNELVRICCERLGRGTDYTFTFLDQKPGSCSGRSRIQANPEVSSDSQGVVGSTGPVAVIAAVGYIIDGLTRCLRTES
jgi:hypothetical protein